jgi:GrpB-like predicted nucleotidyltransferase (UPF0157 family)
MVDDQYLEAHTVGELKQRTTPIEILDYDPAWPQRFTEESAKIRAALGETTCEVEHVGSTSVPGLPAKPIIDIVLVVPDSAAESKYAPQLESAGYRLRIREPEWFEHRLFKGANDGVNLHVFSAGCPEIERMLQFRDWLRINAADRELYARTKRALAQQNWKYTQNYADAKTNVIQEIIARASRPSANRSR